MRKSLALGLALLVAAGAFTACGGDDDKTVDIPGGGQVTGGGDVPDDFPDDFPTYPGADAQGGFSGEQGGVQGFIVSFETDDSVDDVASFYEEELADGPWTSEGNFSSGGAHTFVVSNSDTDQGAGVTISENDGKTIISIVVADEASAIDDAGDGSSGDDDTPSDADGSNGDDGSSSGDDDSSGSADLPDEVDLDDDYPDDILPLPNGARVTQSTSLSTGGSTFINVTLFIEQTVDDMETYFRDTLEASGYEESISTSSDGDVFLTYAVANDPAAVGSVFVNITQSDVEGYTQVDITITDVPE